MILWGPLYCPMPSCAWEVESLTRRKLDKLMRRASSVLGCPLDSIKEVVDIHHGTYFQTPLPQCAEPEQFLQLKKTTAPSVQDCARRSAMAGQSCLLPSGCTTAPQNKIHPLNSCTFFSIKIAHVTVHNIVYKNRSFVFLFTCADICPLFIYYLLSSYVI